MIKKLTAEQLQTATFGAGCFWHVEEAFRKLRGVKETAAGYTGGHTENPSYEDVCSHTTGHAEVVQVTFNPNEISYQDLLEFFWTIHNPTEINRQGPDVGEQYKTVIFYHNPEQKKLAEESRLELEKSGKFKGKIVTEIVPVCPFYKAEEYHQKYLMKNGLDACPV